jgi:flagellar basal-body rod protein FlgC
MDYRSAFQISAAGMTFERTRVEATTLNLANMHNARGADGHLFQPLRAVAGGAPAGPFASSYASLRGSFAGPANVGMVATAVQPRMVHEPGHPLADAKGLVAYPGVNHLGEMVNLVSALRAYEANVVAMNAAKTMALKALELGGNA